MATEKAIFAAGCFWGVEAAFHEVDGVIEAISGYTGGNKEHPTYREVCGDRTGHAEAVEVEFDPAKVSYDRLLDIFWQIHDPTQVNRQGPDVGSQYRSGIFYLTPEQETVAKESRERSQDKLSRPIATEITQASNFWPAEDYHQRYFEKHGFVGCHVPTFE
jgi:peptide-methionine (S)-S-oxide reductase